jgi:hypothetical protein
MMDANIFDDDTGGKQNTYTNDKITIKISRNGDCGKHLFSLSVDLQRDDLYKIKKNVLKKLEVPDYKNREKQQHLRFFTAKGVEVFDYDNLPSFALINHLYFSFGDDFDYNVRLNTLH